MNKLILLLVFAFLLVAVQSVTIVSWDYYDAVNCGSGSGSITASSRDQNADGSCTSPTSTATSVNPSVPAATGPAAPSSTVTFNSGSSTYRIFHFSAAGCGLGDLIDDTPSFSATGCVAASSGSGSYQVYDIDTTGGVAQDPHFYPLNGNASIALMDYTPKGPDGVYNIFTNKNFQWNSRFHSYTDLPFALVTPQFVSEDAFMVRNPTTKEVAKIRFTPAPDAEMTVKLDLATEFNGEKVVLTRGTKFYLFGEEHPEYYLKALSSWMVILVTPNIEIKVGSYYLDLLKRNFSKKRAAMYPKFKWNYLNTNIDVEQNEVDRDSHGLLGQTIRPENPYKPPHKECVECFVKGKISDYRIKGDEIFGTEFKFNKF